jgi:hypothetical protein
MKRKARNISLLFFSLLHINGLYAQIVVPIIKANFGVDADLRANYFNNAALSGNDDWFLLPGSTGTGEFIIDTTGAAALLSDYASNPVSRQIPFYRTMRFPQYAVVNNNMLIDAFFIRDYHGDDSTTFSAGNKNGMSPEDWHCPVSQSVPDKSEILDVMLHIRRAGPNVSDSMWLFGGLSLNNTTGNRYFDFELYQTDIYYDRASRQFFNYGPDAGHTRWEFDPGNGALKKPGDIVLTAEYGSSSLSFIEARIWIDRDDMTNYPNPPDFNWSGSFDGAGSGAKYGYAGIQPKTAGAFYTGLQSVDNTWTGPFQVVLANNTLSTTYTAKQFMEFSVNMSKLGLDDPTIFGNDNCLIPFKRVLIKTRASTSFTAELKDFVGPFDFFLAPKATIDTDVPLICDTGSVSQIHVTNPISTSVYYWTTTNGHILGSNTGTSIYVDTPGTYIVTQRLQAGCSDYAADTITIGSLGNCTILSNKLYNYTGRYKSNINLSWKSVENANARSYIIERSTNGVTFDAIATQTINTPQTNAEHSYVDANLPAQFDNLFYRVRLLQAGSPDLLTQSLAFKARNNNSISLFPNPVINNLQISIYAEANCDASLSFINTAGQTILSKTLSLVKGSNNSVINIKNILPPGLYMVVLKNGSSVFKEKVLVRQ